MAHLQADHLVLGLRSVYLGMAVLVLLGHFITPLRTRFLAYGPRAVLSPPEKKRVNVPATSSSKLGAALDRVGAIQVPHGWFASFYAVSVTCSLLWASQIPLSRSILTKVLTEPHGQNMTWRQVQLTWLLMLAQGSRRLYECMAFHQPSRSQMWLGHWVVGIAFYLATSMAVWIEGAYAVQAHAFSISDLYIAAPDIRTVLAVLLFILASGLQYDCHEYLASLKSKSASTTTTKTDYKTPTHPAFHTLIAPHYFAECVIYASLALVAAPQGAWLNWTLVCALVFVVVNLGVTADGTKSWYEAKFGQDAVQGKQRMIPFLY